MPYYIWKRGEKIVSYGHFTESRPAPAIEVSEEEAKSLGIYTPTPVQESPAPNPTEAEDTAAMLIDHEYRLTLIELGLSEGGET